jgi:putative nucleotidyltransferase with HDIG domain
VSDGRPQEKRVVLVGPERRGLRRVGTALAHHPAFTTFTRIVAPDAPYDGPEPDLAVLDLSARPAELAVAAVGALTLRWPNVGVLAVTSSSEPALVRSVLDAGAQSVLLDDADPQDVRAAVVAAAEGRGLIDVEVVRPTIDLYALLLAESRRRDRSVIESLAAAVEAKDSVTSRHLRRVSRLATELAATIDPELARTEEFLFGCLLHDVGKIGVPEDILGKPGPLTDAEWIVMRRHPDMGARVVRPLGLDQTVVDVVLHHHERWDGGGYPHRLGEDEIPLVARIFAVCDALEAMTAERPYRSPLTPAVALDRVVAVSGTQFDPAVVRALQRGVRRCAIDLENPAGVEPEPVRQNRFRGRRLVAFRR